MFLFEEAVYNKARNRDQYVTFFHGLFMETSKQSKKLIAFIYLKFKFLKILVNASAAQNAELQFKTPHCAECLVKKKSQNLYQLLTNEPERVKYALNEEFKAIDFQIKSILMNWTVEPDDKSFKDVKILPDEFEKSLSVFCAKMTSNYSISECSAVRID